MISYLLQFISNNLNYVYLSISKTIKPVSSKFFENTNTIGTNTIKLDTIGTNTIKLDTIGTNKVTNQESLEDTTMNDVLQCDNTILSTVNCRVSLIEDSYQMYASDINTVLNIKQLQQDLEQGLFQLLEQKLGFTSDVFIYHYQGQKIVKKVYKFLDKNHHYYVNPQYIKDSFNNEVASLKLLEGELYFPQILKIDEEKLIIFLTYCGEALGNKKENIIIDNIPSNWQYQLYHLLITLKKYNLYHNDITERNLCLNKGKIHIIDFGNCKNHIDTYYRNFNLETLFNSPNIIEFLEKINNNAQQIRQCLHGYH